MVAIKIIRKSFFGCPSFDEGLTEVEKAFEMKKTRLISEIILAKAGVRKQLIINP